MKDYILSSRHASWLIPLGALVALFSGKSGGVALFVGALIGVVWGNPWLSVTRGLTKRLLATAVVGLGAGMNLIEVAQAGLHGFGYTFVSIAGCLGLGLTLTKYLKVSKNTGVLISVGTAICGGSAIAASAPTLRAGDDQITVALATVFVLNGIALIIFPIIGHFVGLDQTSFGLWSALAIHDTSSVVGASMSYGKQALKIATTTKLTRALWIVPVTFAISAFVAEKPDRDDDDAAPSKASRPWFILGFLGVAAVVTFVPSVRAIGDIVSDIARQVMVLTLFLVGAGLTRDTLKGLSLKPLLLGVTLWVVVASVSLTIIAAPW